MKKVFVVKKLVVADNLLDAYAKEKDVLPTDIWLDDNLAKDYVATLSKEEKEIGL